jgi:hypothetical protein
MAHIPEIPAHESRRVAVHAACDPRSVEKVVRGEPTQPLTRARIVAALEALGLTNYLPPPVTTPARRR